jgi:hypothetical protein
MQKKKKFAMEYSVNDRLELYKKLIYHYSSTLYSAGDATKVIRPLLLTTLAFYMLYGYSKESRQSILQVLSPDGKAPLDRKILDNLNHELKSAGFLIESKYSKIDKTLSPNLLALRDYAESITDGKYTMTTIIVIKNED